MQCYSLSYPDRALELIEDRAWDCQTREVTEPKDCTDYLYFGKVQLYKGNGN